MTAPALDVFAEPPRPAMSADTASSATWFCTTWNCSAQKSRHAPFSDIERAALLAHRPVARPCSSCGRPMAYYVVPGPAVVLCHFCAQPVEAAKKGNGDPMRKCLAVVGPEIVWAHIRCRQVAKGDKSEAMDTSRRARRMPPCKKCGEPYQEGHGHDLTGAISYCDVDDKGEYIEYEPAESA